MDWWGQLKYLNVLQSLPLLSSSLSQVFQSSTILSQIRIRTHPLSALCRRIWADHHVDTQHSSMAATMQDMLFTRALSTRHQGTFNAKYNA
jgi:hypothetical protein